MAYPVIDTAAILTAKNCKDLRTMRQVHTVMRYITNSPTQRKHIKLPEVKIIKAAGLRLCLNFENLGGSRNFSDINAATGKTHATYARNVSPGLGAPPSAVIYFSIDNGVTAAQIAKYVLPYFKEVYGVLHRKYRIGVYGCGAVCKAVTSAGYATHSWLANAKGWAGYLDYYNSKKWNLLQHLPIKNFVPGLAVDPNDINPQHSDIGDFVPLV